MVVGVDREVQSEALGFFGRAPGFSKEPVDVRAQHRRRVVEGKERIKAAAFELIKPNHAAAATLDGRVSGVCKMRMDPRRIFGIHVAQDPGRWREKWPEPGPELGGDAGAIVFSWTVLFDRNSGQKSLCGHASHSKSKDLATARLNDERNAERQAARVLEALHLVKLKIHKGPVAAHLLDQEIAVEPHGANAEEDEFSCNCVLSDAKQPCCAPLRDTRAEELFDGGIEVPLFLSEALGTGRKGEGAPAAPALEPANEPRVGAPEEVAFPDQVYGVRIMVGMPEVRPAVTVRAGARGKVVLVPRHSARQSKSQAGLGSWQGSGSGCHPSVHRVRSQFLCSGSLK